MVVEDDHDHVAFREVILQLQEAGHRGAGGVPGEDALFARDATRHDGRVLVGHFLEMIDDIEIDVPRQEVFADAFGDVRVDLVLVENAGLLVLLEHRPVGVDAPHLDARVLLLEVPADAADRAAGADAADQVRNRAVRLIPDLRTGLLVVRRGVRQVVVLVGLPGVRDFAFETG